MFTFTSTSIFKDLEGVFSAGEITATSTKIVLNRGGITSYSSTSTFIFKDLGGIFSDKDSFN